MFFFLDMLHKKQHNFWRHSTTMAGTIFNLTGLTGIILQSETFVKLLIVLKIFVERIDQ